MKEQEAVFSPAELGRYLFQLRERADIRQADLAKRVSLSPAVLSRIESGDRLTSLEEVVDILKQIPTTEAERLIQALQRRWMMLPIPPLDHEDQDCLWDAEQVARQLYELQSQPDLPQAFARRIGEYIDELKRCAAQIMKRDHQVAFIGNIGVGKSTSICHMSGLIVQKEDGSVVPVLADGGGGTTICEVHLITGPEYGIAIEPSNSDEIREEVRDFAEYIMKGSSVSDKIGGGRSAESQVVSQEVGRAIRSLSDLVITSSKDSAGKKISTDPAKELAAKCSSINAFVVEVMTRMSLPARDRRQLWYDNASGKAPLTWLRDEFRRVNNGTHPEFTLPKRIDVIMKEPLLRADGLGVRIIDTKGIDRTAAREDLEIHLKDPHTLAVICSYFNDAPGLYAQQLLSRAIDTGVRRLEVNTSVLVLPQFRQAFAMTDDSTGMPVETAEEGYELKREHAEMNMATLGLKDFRIGFYNCFSDAPTIAQEFIVTGLRRARTSFRDQLGSAITGARDLLANLSEEATQAVLEDAAGRLRVWLMRNKDVPSLAGNVQEGLLSELLVVHASAINAAARRTGEWRNFSYSYQLGFGARKLCVAALGKRIDGFSEYCRILQATPGLEASRELITQTERVLLTGFDQMQNKAQLMAQTSYREALKAASELWQACVDEWGQSRGYRQTVAQYSRDWFDNDARESLEKELKEMLNHEWSRVLQLVSDLIGPDPQLG
jgi:transcriptional regulator with XRE-family HTH domain